MSSQEEFLWIVQTMILASVANPKGAPLEEDGNPSSDAAFVAMAEAVRVSSSLPDNLSVHDAAHDFCTYMLPNLNDEEDAPIWMQSQQTRRTG